LYPFPAVKDRRDAAPLIGSEGGVVVFGVEFFPAALKHVNDAQKTVNVFTG
jgi:hypothetical protein